jgi:hypothetical protein
LKPTSRQLSPVARLDRAARAIARTRYFDRVSTVHLPAERRFAIYFLQVQPEQSVEGQAFLYRDQIALVENLAAALPADMELVVKEHRPMIGLREIDYYRRLTSIPNVRLLSDRLKSYELIPRASIVFTLSGSAALEAMYLGIPAIVFGDLFYQAFDGIYKVDSLKDLRATVARVLEPGAGATDAHAVAALAAMYATSRPGCLEIPFTWEEMSDPENVRALADAVEEGLGTVLPRAQSKLISAVPA